MAGSPIISLRDISLSIGQDVLFEDVNLTLHEGAKYAFVGRNGSGKSTLLKLLGGNLEPETGERIPSKDHTVGGMEQHPDLSPFETLEEFTKSNLDPSEAYRADMIAEGLKINLNMSCKTASGGERRRAALTKIIAEAPDLMLLDEPTNHLDIDAILWLEAELAQTSSAYVIISHDRALLSKATNTTLWLDRGVLRSQPKGFGHFEDWRDKIFEEEDQQRHKLNRLIKEEARWAVEGISARRKRNMGRMRRLGDLKDQRSAQIKRQGTAAMALDAAPKSGKLVAEAKNLSHAFGDKVIVQDLSLKIARGDRIALVGPNGAGKSSLLKLLTGQMSPDEGAIRLGSNLITAYFDQNRDALDPKVSLWDTLTDDKEIGISGKNDQIMVRGTPRHVAGYLKEFLFTDSQLRSPVKVLSGGEKARLLLAKLMAKECNLLIMDEPTNDLDVESLDLLQEIIDQFDGTVILVSHDRDFLDRVASKTLAFEGQGVVTTYAGGWSDMQAQRVPQSDQAQKKKIKGKQSAERSSEDGSGGLSFTQKHRLETLPAEIDRLNAEIAKLEVFLADPELFTKEPAKFQKASDGLVERHQTLAQAEEEWLELAELAES